MPKHVHAHGSGGDIYYELYRYS
eukprot:COSAG02_NODE_16601_length_1071_cov_1.731481_2_plen_22_part_01